MASNFELGSEKLGCALLGDGNLLGRDKEDLLELGHKWDEETTLENFRLRFVAGKPYTAAGNVMIALNPCRDVGDLHGRDSQAKYLRYNRTDLPAHAYSVSAAAYWALCEGHDCQTILFGGEPGSGKSAVASVLLEHLLAAADMSRSVCGSQGWVSTSGEGEAQDGGRESERLGRLMKCQRIVLESFGNAETPLNRNSTRFTRHTKVFFSKDASRVVGMETGTLLLETPRLAHCRQGEGTFHAFYQVLQTDEATKKRLHLSGKTAIDFRLTAVSQQRCPAANLSKAWSAGSTREANGMNSSRRWEHGGLCGGEALRNTLNALKAVGLSEEERDSLLRGLSAVMHLGQIEFEDVAGEEIHRDFGVIAVRDESPLEAASAMLGCNKNGLRNALLTRNLAAGGGRMHVSQGGTRRMRGSGEMLAVPLNARQARRATNALTQEVYLRIFRYLVKRINASSGVPPWEERASAVSVGLVDMCGFENLENNAFEQLCNNYAVEKLRGTFLKDVIGDGAVRKRSRKRSGRELAWEHEAAIQLETSRQLLAMFEGPLGVVHIADDECLCPEGSDRSFVYKLVGEAGVQHGRDGEMSRCAGDGDDRRDRGAACESAWPVYADAVASERGSEAGFYVQHFVGPVRYTAANLLEKNQGRIEQTLLDLLDDDCSNVLVGAGSRSKQYRDGRRASSTDGTADHRRQNMYRRKIDESVLSKYRRHLTSLLRQIGDTEVRHVFCVKPNEQLSSKSLDSKGLLRQLSEAGVVAVMRIGSLSLPSGRRVKKEAFFKDFRIVPGAIQRVLNNDGNDCKLGHDTIFFGEGVWELLEKKRRAVERRSSDVIQRAWRQHVSRVQVEAVLKTYIAAQAEIRAHALRLQEERRVQLRQQSSQYFRVVQPAPTRALFESSNANAIREAQRAQEAQSRDIEFRRRQQAVEIQARTEAAAEEQEQELAAKRVAMSRKEVSKEVDGAGRMKILQQRVGRCSPPAMVEAWPVGEEVEAPPSRTPPLSPPRGSPVCSAASQAEEGAAAPRAARAEVREILRLAGLADPAKRNILTKPVSSKYGMMRCRVKRRQDGGLEQLVPAFYMHHLEDEMEFMMSARRQPLSRTANYYISSSPAPDTSKSSRYFVGKLRAHDGSGRSYTLYDDGISPRPSSNDHRQGLFTRTELAGVVFSPTRDAAEGPRSVEASIPVDISWPSDIGMREGGSIADCLREQCRRPGLVRMRDRKPRYDHRVGAYVLDFPGNASKLSVKNVQLILADDAGKIEARNAREYGRRSGGTRKIAWNDGRGATTRYDEEEKHEKLLFSLGKSAADEFLVNFRWPLSPLQAFGLALAALDTSI